MKHSQRSLLALWLLMCTLSLPFAAHASDYVSSMTSSEVLQVSASYGALEPPLEFWQLSMEEEKPSQPEQKDYEAAMAAYYRKRIVTLLSIGEHFTYLNNTADIHRTSERHALIDDMAIIKVLYSRSADAVGKDMDAMDDYAYMLAKVLEEEAKAAMNFQKLHTVASKKSYMGKDSQEPPYAWFRNEFLLACYAALAEGKTLNYTVIALLYGCFSLTPKELGPQAMEHKVPALAQGMVEKMAGKKALQDAFVQLIDLRQQIRQGQTVSDERLKQALALRTVLEAQLAPLVAEEGWNQEQLRFIFFVWLPIDIWNDDLETIRRQIASGYYR